MWFKTTVPSQIAKTGVLRGTRMSIPVWYPPKLLVPRFWAMRSCDLTGQRIANKMGNMLYKVSP